MRELCSRWISVGRGFLAEGAITRALAVWEAGVRVKEGKEAREAWWLEEGATVGLSSERSRRGTVLPSRLL